MAKDIIINTSLSYDSTMGKELNHGRVAKGKWEQRTIQWRENRITTLATQNGISFNVWEPNKRLKANWSKTYGIMLDFDDGNITTEALLAWQNNFEHISYVFSSQNHQVTKLDKAGNIKNKACDRLRFLIPFDPEDPITSLVDLELLQEKMIAKFNGETGEKQVVDRTCMQDTRYFAHGTTVVSNFISNRTYFNWRKLVHPLFGSDFSTVEKQVNEVVTKSKLPGRPKIEDTTFRFTDQVLNQKGHEVLIKDLPTDVKTIIYCPKCGTSSERGGDKANAAYSINKNGIPMIYCSSCESRGEGVSKSGVYNLHIDEAHSLLSKEKHQVVFIDKDSSRYYAGKRNGNGIFAVRHITSKEMVVNHCGYEGIPVPRIFPQMDLRLNFESDSTIDYENEVVNLYDAPQLLKTPIPNSNYRAKFPKYTKLLIDHVFGNDEEIFNHYINDMANFIQDREKMITAYLLQGTEGTGKGTMFSFIWRKIIGEKFCSSDSQDAFAKEFNSFLGNYVYMLINEVDADFAASGSKSASSIVDKIKIAITDTYVQMEGKGQDRRQGRNVCSFMFATNRKKGIVLPKDDRRFNVAPPQYTKLRKLSWYPGHKQLEKLIEDELQEFVWYLKQYSVDHSKVADVLRNDAKIPLMSISSTNAEDFFDAVNDADISWFQNNLICKFNPDEKELRAFSLLEAIVKSLEYENYIQMRNLWDLYNYISNRQISIQGFTKLCGVYSIFVKKIRDSKGRQIRAIPVEWTKKTKKV